MHAEILGTHVIGAKRLPREPNSKKILLIEDDDRLAANLTTLLTRDGHEVARLINGLELREHLERIRPDVVLLDLMLSWVDRYALCRSIKGSPRYADLPVFIISARVGDDDVARGRDAGCDEYFRKPIDLSGLSSRIAALESRGEPAPSLDTNRARG
ncbi:MAG: response regulator transcription factor, partial [Myxococcales bacterium]|nr:response regulator transcription factor [Myxococcales bacterium]